MIYEKLDRDQGAFEVSISASDLGEDVNDLSQRAIDRCAKRLRRLNVLLKQIYSSGRILISGDAANVGYWAIEISFPVRISNRVYMDLIAYGEYYRSLRLNDYPILASVLRSIARCHMTPQMLLEEESISEAA